MNRSHYFVIGVGRSGTRTMARILDRGIGQTAIHEPIGSTAANSQALHDARAGKLELAVDYLRRVRMPYVEGSIPVTEYARGYTITLAGQVDSWLRYHGPALRIAFPEAPVIQLVRDGRDVVRSLMPRGHYRARHEGALSLVPLENDATTASWSGMDRFERICWYWQDGVEAGLRCGFPIVQMEQAFSDKCYFIERVTEPLGVELQVDSWEQGRRRRWNATRGHEMPPWSEWTEGQTEAFWRICGATMERCGYGR